MASGWHKEPRRHALAAKGIKTTPDTKPINKVPLLQNTTISKGVDEWGRKTYITVDGRILKEVDGVLHTTTKAGEPDVPYRPMTRKWDGSTDSGSEWAMLRSKGYGHDEAVAYIERGIIPARFKKYIITKDGEFKGYAESENDAYMKLQNIQPFSASHATKHEGWKVSENKDRDGDGIDNDLDCDPNDPNKQGFFDRLKEKIQAHREIKQYRDDKERKERIEKLRKEAEEREEKLEKEKEEKLLRLKSKIAEKKAIAEIKQKELELDNLQEEIEQLDGSEQRKYNIASIKERTKKGISRVKKRLIEEIKDTPGRRTSIDLSKEELELTSPAKLKALKQQQKKTANEQAKLELEKLKKEEQKIKNELAAIKEKKKAK